MFATTFVWLEAFKHDVSACVIFLGFSSAKHLSSNCSCIESLS